MKELIIYEYQAKHIENTLRIVANVLQSHGKITCLDRDVMQGWEMIKNILEEKKDVFVER